MKKRELVGWIAVTISTAITCYWAFWGIIENFHEGWYYDSFFTNLGLMFLQYLSPFLIFLAITLLSIAKPRLGSGLHGIIGVFAIIFFQAYSNAATFLIILPVFGLGVLYWFGRPKPRKLALLLSTGLPILTLIISGTAPAIRVSQRITEVNLKAVEVSGNGLTLTWSSDGPGWPGTGASWEEARKACEFLGEDGLRLEVAPQDVWRLPRVDEVVRSMTRNGENSGGVWESQLENARYETRPDKEPPLWNVYSQVIYWWTATEVDEDHAFMIAYDGKVWRRPKKMNQPNLGFRCVKSP